MTLASTPSAPAQTAKRALLAAAASLVLLVPACGGDGGDPPGITLGEVAAAPDAYRQQPVSLEGRIEDFHTPSLFTLRDDEDPDESVLVQSDGLGVFHEGDAVRASGELSILSAAEIERELGVALEPDFEAKVGSAPILVDAMVTAPAE